MKMKIEPITQAAWGILERISTGRLGCIFLLFAASCLAGCGSAVLRSDAAARYGNAELREPATVQVVVTDQARRKRHFPKSLSVPDVQMVIEQRLAVNGLLMNGHANTAPRIVIEITDTRIRDRWVATVWGFMAGTDRIHARAMLLDADGRKVNHFNVMTSYAWGGVVGGATSIRIPWIYEEFAEDVVGALTGRTKVKRAGPMIRENEN